MRLVIASLPTGRAGSWRPPAGVRTRLCSSPRTASAGRTGPPARRRRSRSAGAARSGRRARRTRWPPASPPGSGAGWPSPTGSGSSERTAESSKMSHYERPGQDPEQDRSRKSPAMPRRRSAAYPATSGCVPKAKTTRARATSSKPSRSCDRARATDRCVWGACEGDAFGGGYRYTSLRRPMWTMSTVPTSSTIA